MAKYQVSLRASAIREIDRLPSKILGRVMGQIGKLQDDPRPNGCKKIQGGESEWRIRIGDYRVVYSVDDDKASVDVLRVRHRSDVYRS